MDLGAPFQSDIFTPLPLKSHPKILPSHLTLTMKCGSSTEVFKLDRYRHLEHFIRLLYLINIEVHFRWRLKLSFKGIGSFGPNEIPLFVLQREKWNA